MDRYELSDRQEASARHHVRWSKAFFVSLIIGVVFLLLSRAVPWFSSGTPESAMGRAIGTVVRFQLEPFAVTAGLHLLLAICYGYILAMLIFRFETRLAIVLGGMIGLALYGVNYVFFRIVLGTPAINEAPVLFTHIFFSMIFSGAYKGISIPDADQVPET